MTEYAPRGLEVPGRRLWKSVTDEFELAEHERVLLLEACNTADTLARLSVTAAGIDSPSPVLTELRQQRSILMKLFRALGLSGGVDDDERPVPSPVRKRAASIRRSS